MFSTTTSSTAAVPASGYLRLAQIVGVKPVSEAEAARNRVEAEKRKAAGKNPLDKRLRAREGAQGILPISESTWWQGVRAGRFPKPVRLGPRIVAWRAEDIRELLANPGRRWG